MTPTRPIRGSCVARRRSSRLSPAPVRRTAPPPGAGQLHHALLVPIALFLVEFMVLDAHLSLAFLNWPLRSLNDFGLVDRSLYRCNWSRAGKALNSGALVVLMLTTESPLLCTALVVG